MRLGFIAATGLLSASMFGQAATPAAPAAMPAPATLKGSIAGHPDWPRARPADVDSVDHILAALYGAISGPAGQPRDWVRLRSICVPDARLIPSRGDNASADVFLLSVDDYIARSSTRMETTGFFERSTHNTIDTYGNMVHVFSTYESRHTAADPKPFARGINSIQMLKDGSRFWIVNIFWDAERPETPIPAKYLP